MVCLNFAVDDFWLIEFAHVGAVAKVVRGVAFIATLGQFGFECVEPFFEGGIIFDVNARHFVVAIVCCDR